MPRASVHRSVRTRLPALALAIGLVFLGLEGAGWGDGRSFAAVGRLPAHVTGTTTTTPVFPAANASGAAPTSAGVARQVASLVGSSDFGSHYGLYVYDASRNRAVYAHNTAAPFTPASTMKLLTTAAVLAKLGPQHRFTTSVVAGSNNQVILKGGGDPTLESGRPGGSTEYPPAPTVSQLAARTAAALKAAGRRSVTVGYDATLFAGPAVNAHWNQGASGYVATGVAAPTSALWVDKGEETPGVESRRSANPALAAARVFAADLEAAGVTVTGTPTGTRAAAGARTWASVQSAYLASIVERCLTHSDNDIAEVLQRQVSVASNGDGSYTSGVASVKAALTGLGLSTSGATVLDGSGLARANRLPLPLLAGVVRTAASEAHPELRAVITGLPIAGFNGSLQQRFGPPATAGEGYVRSKTGTLSGVNTYAGLVYDTSGTLLVFAEAADATPGAKTSAARLDLDRVAAALYGCGCG